MNESNGQLQSASGKKIYQVPQLRIYGDVLSVTQASGAMGKNADSGKGVNNKTF